MYNVELREKEMTIFRDRDEIMWNDGLTFESWFRFQPYSDIYWSEVATEWHGGLFVSRSFEIVFFSLMSL